VTEDLDNQLAQLDELLSLFDTSTLQAAQQAVEHQIAELSDRLETTRQALAHAQSQRRRLARARLLLEESSAPETPAAAPAEAAAPVEVAAPAEVHAEPARSAPSPPDLRQVIEQSAPTDPVGGSYLPDRRRNERRRLNGN
jgi:hypothetical protein